VPAGAKKFGSGYSRELFKISSAANLPDAAITPPPGWVQAPHM
jgi:hypothetical protein